MRQLLIDLADCAMILWDTRHYTDAEVSDIIDGFDGDNYESSMAHFNALVARHRLAQALRVSMSAWETKPKSPTSCWAARLRR